MSADPKRIIVTASCCHACSVHTVLAHHQTFPEMRTEGRSAEMAAEHLAHRLEAALDTTPNSLHREAIRQAIDDTRAFLNREGHAHLGRDISEPQRS